VQAPEVGRVAEEEGEGDIGDAGLLSRAPTVKDQQTSENDLDRRKTRSKDSHDMPFTGQQLTQALTEVTLGNSPPKVLESKPVS